MPKLWIVHPHPSNRAALARLCGVADSQCVAGAPGDPAFETAPSPALVLLGLEGDFERELEFAHRHRARLRNARWLLLCRPDDARDAARLFASVVPEILDTPPTARILRSRIAAAVAQRDVESLDQRRVRARVAERFSAWLGGVEVPGLLRALDPSLMRLPLLVRGASGSGRALLCRYVELFRGLPGSVLRVHAAEIETTGALAERLRRHRLEHGHPARTVWIDEIDLLPVSTQRALAEWILHETPPERAPGDTVRWIATAGPSTRADALEPSLERAFSPLAIEVPSLAEHPDGLRRFADEIARDWSRQVGGPVRRFGETALELLAAQPWSGDREEVEAVLRTTLAAATGDPVEADDLRFPSDLPQPSPAPTTQADPQAIREDPARAPAPDPIEALPIVEAEALSDASASLFEEAYLEAAPAADSIDLGRAEEHEFPMPALENVELESEAEQAEAPDTEPLGVDESVLLSEASFAMADPADEIEPAAEEEANDGWRRLARSLSHEIRNPLVSIRTFTELLPEHFEDETFRERFTELVGRDVAHINDVIARLSTVAEREKLDPEAVDVSALIEELLDARRERIGRGRLLVLRELERDAPLAWADGHCLQVALAGLLDRALESLPERGDLFVATRRIDRGAEDGARLRVLLRHHNPELAGHGASGLADLDPASNVLEYVLAETIVEASGGTLTIDTTDAQETLILVDLRTPV